MKYKALALDMDGTLLNHIGELEDQVVDALRKAQDAGIGVYLVSGRMQKAIYPFWKRIGLTTPIISYNGCRIMHPDDDKPLYEVGLSYELSQEIIAYAKGRGLSLNTYYSDCLYTLEDNEYSAMYAKINQVQYKILPEDFSTIKDAPTKALVIVSTCDDAELLGEVNREMIDKFGDKVHVTTSSQMYVELLPKGANKATGLQKLNDIVGLELSDWVAIGDGMNDMEMLKECGVGLAVESAPQDVRDNFDKEFIVQDLPRGGIEIVLEKYFGLIV